MLHGEQSCLSVELPILEKGKNLQTASGSLQLHEDSIQMLDTCDLKFNDDMLQSASGPLIEY